MSRYLPPIGTAGFERVAVRGKRRVPWPPPRMIANVSLFIRRQQCRPCVCSTAGVRLDVERARAPSRRRPAVMSPPAEILPVGHVAVMSRGDSEVMGRHETPLWDLVLLTVSVLLLATSFWLAWH